MQRVEGRRADDGASGGLARQICHVGGLAFKYLKSRNLETLSNHVESRLTIYNLLYPGKLCQITPPFHRLPHPGTIIRVQLNT